LRLYVSVARFGPAPAWSLYIFARDFPEPTFPRTKKQFSQARRLATGITFRFVPTTIKPKPAGATRCTIPKTALATILRISVNQPRVGRQPSRLSSNNQFTCAAQDSLSDDLGMCFHDGWPRRRNRALNHQDLRRGATWIGFSEKRLTAQAISRAERPR
jgi:hypothetical protein